MEQAVRAGNRERGWNDPPEFLHPEGSNTSSYTASKLNKRVAHSLDGTVQPTEVAISPSPVLTEPPVSSNIDANKTAEDNTKVENKAESDEPKKVLSKEDIEKILKGCVQICQENNVGKRICDDILKRIKLFANSWTKLNEAVKGKMGDLAQALEETQYPKANEFHIQLMMDYPSEVCQWMSGIKRLIHELTSIQSSKNQE